MKAKHHGDETVDLWRHPYRYFTEEKKLNNLLWAYSPSSNAHEKVSVMFYCPGGEFVDIVGVDYYGNEVVLDGYEELTRLDKPFGLTEFGPSLDSSDDVLLGWMCYHRQLPILRKGIPPCLEHCTTRTAIKRRFLGRFSVSSSHEVVYVIRCGVKAKNLTKRR